MSDRIPPRVRSRIIAWLRFVAIFCLVFVPVYVGGGWLAAASGRAFVLVLPGETGIPLVPWMVWPYLSLYPLFLMPLFHLDPPDMAVLTRQSVAVLAVAALAFVLLPGRLAYAVNPVEGLSGTVIALIRATDTPHNTVPSLHVAFAWLILLACLSRAGPRLAWLYRAWMALMAVSALLVHQHHILDIAAGAGLALAVRGLMPMPAAAAAR
ncbi:MAG: hypothetical protein KDJ29_15855 [Hyphomicrobiales bacterium]|nr:hypothetical protein [Hyphomicrobiales bacterium]